VNGAIRGEHSLLEEIKERSLCDTEQSWVGRFGCGCTRIITKPLNVNMAEHEVTSRFMSDKGIGGTIPAEHAVRIRVEVCHIKNRQVFNSGESRPIVCADNFCHWVPLVLDCDFSSLGIPLYVSIAGQPKFVAIVIGGRNTASNSCGTGNDVMGQTRTSPHV
jgi:hypothetical protein